MARTYLVDPSKRQQEEYAALLAALEAAVKALVPGAPCSAAHAAAVEALEVGTARPLCSVQGSSKNPPDSLKIGRAGCLLP